MTPEKRREAIIDANSPPDSTLVLAVLGPDGRSIFGVGPHMLTGPVKAIPFRIGRLASKRLQPAPELGFSLRPIGDNWLLSGHLLTDWETEQGEIERAFLIALVLSIALGTLAGLIVTRYVARRLDEVVRTVGDVAAGDLSQRVPATAGGGDAFDRLARQLNAMLDKLERLMTELRIVTDSLAHDLRSPLARLRSRTESALLVVDPAQHEAALAGLLNETDLVMRMLSMLIEISRSESVPRDRFTMVDPAELIEEIGELYEPVAEDAGVSLTIATEGHPRPLALHRELMTQALTNLIDNALRHAADGGAITLRLAQGQGNLVIQVEDRGPGIAAADREQALKRFGRLDRARSTPGAGLGLSLIQAVAHLHGGRFELDDNRPGLVARIVVPL